MHKVNHHGRRFAIDVLFTGAVKVELQQLKRFSVNAQFAARRYVDLNGVAVVQYFEWAGFVIGRNVESNFLKRAFDVQR